MADTPDLPITPEKKVRKTPTRRAAASKATTAKASSGAAPKKRVSPRTRAAMAGVQAEAPSFAESATQARAALDTATAAARAKVKALSGKTSIDWKAQNEKLKAQGEQMYDKASRMAHETAGSAKAHTGSAMQSLARLIRETAETVDTKLGPQYGDYARQAASAVAGAGKSLDDKDVDQLLSEARDFVRKSPAVAIGAAAVAGFVLMRLAKGSGGEGPTDT